MNRLSKEKSPYLLQHADNPVDWYPWGDEAFAKAKRDNKPIFLSIGYATCHWCHVMERESFENEDIARFMNENFVNIKVDREERPDVDQIYMTAVQAMTGAGGWPLSVFLTPDLEPFFGGTYFAPNRGYGRPGFVEVLNQIALIWRSERDSIAQSGRKLTDAIRSEIMPKSGPLLDEEIFKTYYFHLEQTFDADNGGFGSSPKFPRSEALSLLLRIYRRTGQAGALMMVEKTLDAMARGGIYDHLGGGFARYSTDARWLIPHFEKMLYDNALIAQSYLEAYQLTKNPQWADVARETLDYILRDMTASEGGFYSAEDADSEGEEGKFYTWSESELEKILTADELKSFKKIFPLSLASVLNGKHVLHMDPQVAWSERNQNETQVLLKKLFDHRLLRERPSLDDKILTSWNGLMISALSKASQILDNEDYLRAAQKAATFLLGELWNGETLLRRYRDGEARYPGTLEDYAFLTAALIDLFETDSNPRWFDTALALQRRTDALFWDLENGAYFFTDGRDKTLIIRTKDLYDGALPSGNSVAATNLMRLYQITLDETYRKRAETLITSISGQLQTHPEIAPSLLSAVDIFVFLPQG